MRVSQCNLFMGDVHINKHRYTPQNPGSPPFLFTQKTIGVSGKMIVSYLPASSVTFSFGVVEPLNPKKKKRFP